MYSSRTLIFVIIVTVGLVLLYYLPTFTVGEMETQQVDLFSDLRAREIAPALAVIDTIDSTDSVIPEKTTFCNEYLTDYSGCDSTLINRGLDYFFHKLLMVDSLDRPVRIAYFGDSFVEGDILTEDLRFLFQNKFGGSGVGYVPVHHPVANLRKSVISQCQHWSSHHVTDRQIPNPSYIGVDGMYFCSDSEEASITLKGRIDKADKFQDKATLSEIYYKTDDSLTFESVIEGVKGKVSDAYDGECISSKQTKGSFSSVSWMVKNNKTTAVVYGTTMETSHGICLDNLGLRNTTGMHLATIDEKVYQDFFQARRYDLIIIAYGLNVVSKKSGIDYSYFTSIWEKGIQKMARCSPGTSFLIISIGDRAKRMAKDVESYESITELANYQKSMACHLGCAFWDLNSTMKSIGGIASMVDAKPPMAAKDYTHINFEGGKVIAKRLFDDLMSGFEFHHKQRINQNKHVTHRETISYNSDRPYDS